MDDLLRDASGKLSRFKEVLQKQRDSSASSDATVCVCITSRAVETRTRHARSATLTLSFVESRACLGFAFLLPSDYSLKSSLSQHAAHS